MKAVAVFPQERSVRLIDVVEPHIQTDLEVKLRILEVGICGTDREICRFVYGVPPSGLNYFILGHECLAQVVETGSATWSFAGLDSLAFTPNVSHVEAVIRIFVLPEIILSTASKACMAS